MFAVQVVNSSFERAGHVAEHLGLHVQADGRNRVGVSALSPKAHQLRGVRAPAFDEGHQFHLLAL